MKLALRKEKILYSVVESYILSGEPVGSKSLQADFEMKVSSATIRNELADLTLGGFLIQPHTSAGRIPTDYGYRYYIDNLMPKKFLAQSVRDRIYGEMSSAADSPESVLKSACAITSRLLNLACAATTPSGNGSRVHRIRFVSVSRKTAMAVLVTSSGTVKSGLFRCDFVITLDMLSVFDKALNEKLSGCPLEELTAPFMQTVAASFGELALFMPSVLTVILKLAEEALSVKTEVAGKMNLLYNPQDMQSGINALRFLNSPQLAKLLVNKSRNSNVLVGAEIGIPELKGVSVLMSGYEISGTKAGVLAVIGPKRMDYSANLAVLDCVASAGSALINELVNEY